MNPKSVITFLAVLLAGVLGAAAAYQAVLPSSSAEAPRESLVIEAGDDPSSDNPSTTRDTTRNAKCKKPAVLVGKICVIDVVKTVVVPAAPSGSSSSGGDSRGPGPSQVRNPQDDEGRPEVRDDNSGHGSSDDDGDDDRDDDTNTHTNTGSGNSGSGSDDDDDTRTSTRTRTGH